MKKLTARDPDSEKIGVAANMCRFGVSLAHEFSCTCRVNEEMGERGEFIADKLQYYCIFQREE